MKIKLEENMPSQLALHLSRLGHDVETVPQEGLAGNEDSIVWAVAQNEGRFFITQDLDFSDIKRFASSHHAGLLIVRLRTPNRRALVQRLCELFQTDDAESWTGCFVVVTERKLRVRRIQPFA
ncbi:MAG: DUF5615 family PIN-like protein [Candidatus Hydrogenedentes bacterium]|nr:DUF5615 family PIN-like protein [Candidatus Hydrogenedentota bacterium]